MAVGNGNPGISNLAKVISQRSQRYAEDTKDDLQLEFGTVLANMSLQTNSFPIPIPKGEYMVLRHAGGLSFKTGSTGVGDHGNHSHSVDMPKLKKGDHVLVAWVHKEPVVLDVIVSSK